MSYATKEQLAELAAYMASQIRVPTIGIGGGYAPIGTIISYMGTSAPQDYLACDGSVVDIEDYPQLADLFESQFGSKNYFGGDGTTTFAVPDLRGEFLRGTGTNSHTNQGGGANVGEHQDATNIPYSFIYTTGDMYAKRANSSASNFVSNLDSQKKGVANVNYSDRYATAQNYVSDLAETISYTPRPTNTSVLYCIKAVVAGDVYSTEERVVGTWIDGKPLYQRTYVGTTPSTADTVGVIATLDLGVVVRTITGMVASAVPINYDGGTNYYSRCFIHETNKIAMQVKGYVNHSVTITVQYTKTTD